MTTRSFIRLNLPKKSTFKGFLIRNIQNVKSFCSTTNEQSQQTPVKKVWDIKNLKLEVNRVYLRTFKKVGKANERLDKALIEYNDIINTPDVPLSRLEECPNPETLQSELKVLQDLLAKLFYIEEELKNIKSVNDVKFIDITILAKELEITDIPVPKQERGNTRICTFLIESINLYVHIYD
jgi:mevalonate kinase